MSWKKLFYDNGEGEDPDLSSKDPTTGSLSPVVPRQVHRTPNPTTLTALRLGPSATLFERTTGLQHAGTSVSLQPTPAVDREFDAVIGETLDQDSKEPGFREFIIQLSTLASFIADKKQCTIAALAAVSATNPKLNATQIARAIGERLQLLSTYDSSYEADSRRTEQTENGDKNSGITEANNRIKELDIEIARLTGERAQLQSQIQGLERELSGVTQKYDEYRSRFNITISARREYLKQLLNYVAPSAQEGGK